MKSRTDSKGILGTLMYLAFGLMVYVVLFQPESGFSWANPWTYIVAVFWPFALIYEFFIILFWGVLIALAAIGIYHLLTDLGRRRSASNDDEPR